jgi:diguanylate cyclase
MDSTMSLSQSAQCLKKVIPMMSNYQIPFTPVNYAIWYCYTVGKNPEFNLRLDDILSSYGTCPPDKAKMLFDEFLSDKDLALFHEISANFQETMDDVKNEIGDTLISSQSFSTLLSECNSGLHQFKSKSEESYDEVLNIVDQLSTESVLMQKNAQSFQQKLESAYAEINNLKQTLLTTQEAANTDPLTGLNNRGCFDKDINSFCLDGASPENLCTLIFMDIDHFKQFNDDFGHQKGDDVLKVVANKLINACDESSKAYRYGGEEFCVLGTFSSLANAFDFTENIRKSIAKLSVKAKGSGKSVRFISASFGISFYNQDKVIGNFIERADKALYLAKDQGRNRTEIIE